MSNLRFLGLLDVGYWFMTYTIDSVSALWGGQKICCKANLLLGSRKQDNKQCKILHPLVLRASLTPSLTERGRMEPAASRPESTVCR